VNSPDAFPVVQPSVKTANGIPTWLNLTSAKTKVFNYYYYYHYYWPTPFSSDEPGSASSPLGSLPPSVPEKNLSQTQVTTTTTILQPLYRTTCGTSASRDENGQMDA